MSNSSPTSTRENLLTAGRSHHCGALRASDIGQHATLMGWVHNRRDHGGAIFIDLRDRYGVTQVVFRPDEHEATHADAGVLRSEFCLAVRGRVDSRGENVNDKLATGAIELTAQTLQVFSPAQTPPFLIEDNIDTGEATRLKYRYLDLRRPELQKNFMLRSKTTRVIREYLHEQSFLELETPVLIKNTPGGARNFVVPSRMDAGSFYALAESPQIYKQLFMVSGFDRYFQIVRCFRDEDLRGDRQPEFTQVDIELSFPTEDRIYAMMEGLICAVFSAVMNIELPRPFPRMTYHDALANYGTDKPDLRFGLPLCDVSAQASGSGFRVFQGAIDGGGLVKLLRLPGGAAQLSRKDLDSLPALVKPVGAKGVAYARIQEGGKWQAPFAKAMTAESMEAIGKACGAQVGDVLLFLADRETVVNNALSLLRGEMARRFGLVPSQAKDSQTAGAEAPHDKAWAPLWVTEFPIFEKSEETKQWTACHHPFTAPVPEDVKLIPGDKQGDARARAYDLVLNGVELAGGSIRIHESDVQARIFRALGISDDEARQKFSFLLDAFGYGAPPHGGIAMGLDRLIMLLCGCDSLRDVIAFPKTQRGTSLMTGAPTPVEDDHLNELHIRTRKPAKA